MLGLGRRVLAGGLRQQPRGNRSYHNGASPEVTSFERFISNQWYWPAGVVFWSIGKYFEHREVCEARIAQCKEKLKCPSDEDKETYSYLLDRYELEVKTLDSSTNKLSRW